MRNNYTKRFFARGSLMLRSIVILAALMIGFAVEVSAQATLQGKVTDESGEPLPGANIFIKGSTIGTISDFDGNFSLVGIPEGNQALGVSFMGYQTIEESLVFVSGSTVTKDFVMREDNEQLEEVVVIGYGVQKKKLVTGANAQVSGDDLQKMNTTNALQALQGQTAGVNITSTSGQPGEQMKVSVRGVGSLNGSTPLYIVDGVQTGDISYLNNSDIESIDILKDAASAAIYGSQASNGVVLITTKGGKKGHSQVYFDGYYGVQNLAKKVDMLGAYDYAMIMNEQAANSGTSIADLPFDLNNLPSYLASGNANTDWLDEMFVDNAAIQSYTAGATGGNDISTYALSIGYMGQEGIVGGKDESDYNRYTARINTEHKLYDGVLKVGEHLSYSHVKKNGIQVGNQYGNSLRSAFNTSPLLPMYEEDGVTYFNTAASQLHNGEKYWYTSEANPYASMYYGNQNLTKETKVVGDLYFALEPVKNLVFRSSIGIDYYGSDYRKFTPIFQLSDFTYSDVTKVEQNQRNSTSLSWDNTLSYGFKIGENKIDVMAGTWMQRYDCAYLFAYNTNLAYSDFQHAWIDNTTSDNTNGTMRMNGNPEETRMLSYFGRLQWNFKEKYMLNATFRADGSSKFTEDNRWGYFPSVSAGWVVSEENFMHDQNIFDMLKIRASWGQVGNQAITDFQYLATVAFSNATYPFGDGASAVQGDSGASSNGSYPQRLANMDLKWETSEQLDFGFDARFLKNTLTINFDWYKKSTKNWLIIAPVVGTAGADAPYINGGNCENTGVELGIIYQNHIGKFNYNVSLNGSYNKNEVTKIPTEDGIIHGSTNQLYDNSTEFYRCESGNPVGYFWGYKTAGIFQSQADIDAWKAAGNGIRQSKVQPGDVKYVDIDNNGVIDDYDKVNLGSPNPKYIFGFTLSCDYKALDFMVSANGVAGNKIVQSYRNITNKNANYTTSILNRWHGEGTSNKIPRVTENATENWQFSDLFVQKGDFLRISNVTLGYDFCKQFRIPVFTQLRVYFSVQNLYTFTKYDGLDPEVGFGIDGGVTDKFSSGIDLGFYPRPRTYMFGVNLKL